MKKVKVVILYGAVLWIAGCALPVGDTIAIERPGSSIINEVTDYNLQSYVPIPKPGEAPVTQVSRGGVDVSVVWRDSAGIDLAPFPAFEAGTVYRAEITLSAGDGYGFDPAMRFAYPDGKVENEEEYRGSSGRTVMVTYNNSDHWNITYITEYDLQKYVPVPVALERPVWTGNNRADLSVTVTWKGETSPASGDFTGITQTDTFAFTLGVVYQARIQLTAKEGYRFFAARNFAYTDGTEADPEGSESDPETRGFAVTYKPTKAPKVINDFNLTPHIVKPANGGTGVGNFAGSQYTATVSWRNTATQAPLTGPFEYGLAYTAELTLTPVSGYTLRGVGEDAFEHTGAVSVTNPADSGVVTLKFPPTAAASYEVVYDTILTGYIPKPVSRATPVRSFTGTQYRGTVAWSNSGSGAALTGHFQAGVSYTAVVTLAPLPGYTFDGIGQNKFSHTEADAVFNGAGSGIVTVKFPPAGTAVMAVARFGPDTREDSALKLMKDQKDNNNPVFIELSPGEETVSPGTSLTADYNSPVNITIDGGGRILRLEGPGILITVGSGINLTLRNITLQGVDNNNRPLVRVQPGGALTLGAGAALTGNETSANIGGVWVNGGRLTMNAGAAIKKMIVSHFSMDSSYGAGGVLVDGTGEFTMYGGTIGGESEADGNAIAHADDWYFAGGVRIEAGSSFAMYGGTIQFNTAATEDWGAAGGVSSSGIFNMHGGNIKGNKSLVHYSAGGVINWSGGTFVMHNPNAVIENNSAASGSGGGVKNDGTFRLTAGIIRNNSCDGAPVTLNYWEYGGVSAGGVLNSSNGSMTMTGGTIADNTLHMDRYGGAGGVYNSGNFTMQNGGVISGNRAVDPADNCPYAAGGVYVASPFRMEGGTIKDNYADPAVTGGNAVTLSWSDYGYLGGIFTMSGGAITGNNEGGNPGVYVGGFTATYGTSISPGEFTISDTARIDEKVLLWDFAVITIGGDWTGQAAVDIQKQTIDTTAVAGFNPLKPRVLKAAEKDLITDYIGKFKYNGDTNNIDIENLYQDGEFWYVDHK
jgi:hypothetical protein